MQLNRLERLAMNNPLRSVLQRRVEARRLLRMGGRAAGARALEIGCGRGVGADLVLSEFGADSVDAFDFDPKMAVQAKRRLAGHGSRARVWVGDAAAIAATAATYDAVFDFGIIHHVPQWRRAVREVQRVLKPGGLFYGEEVLRAVIDHPLARRLLDRPRHDRFDAAEFLGELESTGFELVGREGLGSALVLFVARKPAAA